MNVIKKSQQPAESNFNWTFFSPLQVHLSFAPHGEGAGSMVKRQCVAINSARRSSIFCFFGKLSRSFGSNEEKADHDRHPMASVGLYQLSTVALLQIWSSSHVCAVCRVSRKYITFKWIYLFSLFYTLSSIVRTALFPWISIARERRKRRKIDCKRLMMLRSSSAKWNGKVRIDRFFLAFALLLRLSPALGRFCWGEWEVGEKTYQFHSRAELAWH